MTQSTTITMCSSCHFALGLCIVLELLLFLTSSSALTAPDNWRPLPHVERRDVFLSGASLAAASLVSSSTAAVASSQASISLSPRSVAAIDSHLAIPVWPSWAGGQVVPVSLGGSLQDPFLLLAHHNHWFDPKDPLREPFKAVGKALGLPYVDVEGFSMHPHRGFDILTYVLDGSDGFRHRDSLGGSRTYRGGSAQWMRTGSGVLHEEFWETRPDRRTNIELFQLWVNLPGKRKFDPPFVKYVGKNTDDPWFQSDIIDPTSSSSTGEGKNVVGTVRDLGSTLDQAIEQSDGAVEARPPVRIMHATIEPNAQWTIQAPCEHSALVYVRKGVASFNDNNKGSPSAAGGSDDDVQYVVKSQQTVTFAPDGDFITICNRQKDKRLDLLLFTAMPLQEPVVQAGPIVMNTASELNDAYQQLSDGTFLNRDYVLQQQSRKAGHSRV